MSKKIKFKKEEESRAGKVFLWINYMSGDADGDFPEEIELKDIKFSKELELPDEYTKLIKDYKLVASITDCNDKNYLEDYDQIKEQHGEYIANMWDNGKNDPQGDYNTKCHITDIWLEGYDENGTKYKAYL